MIIPFPSVSGKSFKIPWFQTTNQNSIYIYIPLNPIKSPFLFQSPPIRLSISHFLLVKLSCILYNKNDPLPGPAIFSRMAKPRSQKPAWKNPVGNIKPRTSYGEQHENMEKSIQNIQVTWSTWRNRQNQSWWKWIILIMDCPLENLNTIESSKVPNRSPSMLLIGYTTHLLHAYPIYPLMPGKKQECLGGIVFPRSCG